MRPLLFLAIILAHSLAAVAAPESQLVTIKSPVKVTVHFPEVFAIKHGPGGLPEITTRKNAGRDAPAMMLMSTQIDLSEDADDERMLLRFLLGEDKEAKIHRQGKLMFIVLPDDPKTITKGRYIKTS